MSDLLQGDNECCDMPLKTRFIWGSIFAVVGAVLSILAFITFVTSDLATFSFIYTVGVLCSLGASFFFTGPKKHLSSLKNRDHLIATIGLFVSIILVFVFVYLHLTFLVVIFLITEYISLFFFYVSMFPGGMAAIKGILRTIF